MKNTVDLGKTVDAKDLYDTMQKSVYMNNRKYEILYANAYYGTKEEFEIKDGIKHKKTVPDKNKIEGYGICFSHDDESIYTHIRISGDSQVDEFSYGITMGNQKIAEKDILELAKEIKNIL